MTCFGIIVIWAFRFLSPVFLVYSNNIHYLRMRALQKLSSETYRNDVVSGNVADYIMEGVFWTGINLVTAGLTQFVEYTKARESLGELSDERADSQYSSATTPVWKILSGMVGDLPVVSAYFSQRDSRFLMQKHRFIWQQIRFYSLHKFLSHQWLSFNRRRCRCAGLLSTSSHSAGKSRCTLVSSNRLMTHWHPKSKPTSVSNLIQMRIAGMTGCHWSFGTL